ncbi:outer membrane protein assembly factor BamB family protein [Salinigranum halophilum]|uniref:outer membrane protein assembly factor BamB family protein n=1 Tax=Salinigranum halophilum TaxID=2565931 RepID=UPI0010A8CD2B|nr:PQQ-binding-like beta-propeller repeat protein [Salinigranum halophilum]
MDDFSRRRTLGLLAGTTLSGLAGCATELGPFSADESLSTTGQAGGGPDSPLTVRRVALDRTPPVMSTYQTSFSGPHSDWAAQALGAPESASLLIEVECSLSDGHRQAVTRLECIAYDESGIEQERWTRQLNTTIDPGVWTLREQLGAELEPGTYILEPRLQVDESDTDGSFETLASGRVECTVISSATNRVELPWQDLDADRQSELHIGLPYTTLVDADDSRVAFADPVVQQLVTSAQRAQSDLPDWYFDELIGITPDVPSLASGTRVSHDAATDTAAVDVVDHGDGRVTLYWANHPVTVDGSTVEVRYDRAFVIATVGPEATVTDPGGADYVFSEGPRTETTLVWLPTRVGKQINPSESDLSSDRFSLAQHSFRVERAPPPPETATPTSVSTPTPSEADGSSETATAMPTPMRPEAVDITAQVQLQFGPLRSRTTGPLTFREPVETPIDEAAGVYDVAAWQSAPEESYWMTVGFTQTTDQAVFPVVDSESETADDSAAEATAAADSNTEDNEVDEGPPWRRGNWPTRGADSARTGNSSPTVGVASGRSREWRVETGSSDAVDYQRAVNSSPAIVDGTVYVGSNDQRVYAVDALTGEVQWQYRLDGPVRSSPTVVDGVLYIGSESGTVYALDCSDTVEPVTMDADEVDSERTEQATRAVWSARVGSPVQTAPAVSEGTVYIGGKRNTLYSLDAKTGQIQWETTVDRENPDAAITAPTVTAEQIIVGSSSGRLHAFGRDGRRQWDTAIGGGIRSEPAAFDATLYLGTDDGRVYALDADSGDQMWEAETGDRVVASPAVSKETVYATSTDGRLYAFERNSGLTQWSLETNDAILSSPAVGGNTVYTGSRDGRLYAIDAWHGRVRWNRRLSAPVVYSSPAVVDGLVSVGTINGALHGVLSFR